MCCTIRRNVSSDGSTYQRTVGDVASMFLCWPVSWSPVAQVTAAERALDAVSVSSIEETLGGQVTGLDDMSS